MSSNSGDSRYKDISYTNVKTVWNLEEKMDKNPLQVYINIQPHNIFGHQYTTEDEAKIILLNLIAEGELGEQSEEDRKSDLMNNYNEETKELKLKQLQLDEQLK